MDTMYQRRMPKMEKIPLLTPPSDLEGWYKNQKFSGEEVTAFTLRDFQFRSPSIVEYTITDLVLKYSDDKERIATYKKGMAILNQTTDIFELMEMLENKAYFDLRTNIRDKMVSLDNEVYIHFLDKLKRPVSELISDTTMIVLARKIKEKDISDEVIALLENNYIRSPYEFAGLLQILGFQKTDKNLRLLYTFHNFFKNNFPDENYFEGPLFGIDYYLYP